MTAPLRALAVQAATGNEGRPGWLPLLILIAMGAVVAFLYFSMKKQLGRIDIPDDADNGADPPRIDPTTERDPGEPD